MSPPSPAQPEPGHDDPDAAFPSESFPVGLLYRAHGTAFSTWYFSSSGRGRFDLQGEDGTCYLADDIETATREHLRELIVDTQAVSEARASHFEVARLAVALEGRMGSITHRLAPRFRVLRELCTTADYALTQRWARAFWRRGFAGLRYASRFTGEPGPNAWARFGPTGVNTALDAGVQGSVPGAVACGLAGITVIVPPYSRRGLTILPPP